MFSLALMNGIVIGMIYALSALGVSLVVGIMNVVNFAHGELYILAGYFSFIFADALGWNIYISMAVAVGLVFLFGILIEYTLIRPTYGNDMYSLILTFILSIVLQNAYLLIFGPYPNKPPNWVKGATNVLGQFYYGNQRLAAEYDVTRWALLEAKRYIPLLNDRLQDPDYRIRREVKNWLTKFKRSVGILEPELANLTRRLAKADLVLCMEQDDTAWYFRHAALCDHPIDP